VLKKTLEGLNYLH
jgi:serine/threonine protein kinase